MVLLGLDTQFAEALSLGTANCYPRATLVDDFRQIQACLCTCTRQKACVTWHVCRSGTTQTPGNVQPGLVKSVASNSSVIAPYILNGAGSQLQASSTSFAATKYELYVIISSDFQDLMLCTHLHLVPVDYE